MIQQYKQLPTSLSLITGFASLTNILGLSFLMIHVAVVFLAVRFPFKRVEYEAKGYMKYFYAISTITATVVACVLTAVRCASEHEVGSPPLGCNPADPDVNYYTTILPPLIIRAIASTLLIVIFCELIKAVFFHYKRSGRKVCAKI